MVLYFKFCSQTQLSYSYLSVIYNIEGVFNGTGKTCGDCGRRFWWNQCSKVFGNVKSFKVTLIDSQKNFQEKKKDCTSRWKRQLKDHLEAYVIGDLAAFTAPKGKALLAISPDYLQRKYPST